MKITARMKRPSAALLLCTAIGLEGSLLLTTRGVEAWLNAERILHAQEKTPRADSTEMGKLAARMEPGTWAELKTKNLVKTLQANGASGAIFGYSEDGAWDPKNRQFLYCGGDHGDRLRFVAYSTETNAWRVMPEPYWASKGTSHGYDHNAINPVAGEFYFRPFSRKIVYSYNIAEGKWSELPPLKVPDYVSCCNGVEYFPELGGLVMANLQGRSVHLFKESSRQWMTLARELPPAGYHTFAEYNPAHKVMIFGGGGAHRELFKLDRQGKVTQLKEAPLNLGTMNTIVTVDPVEGDYLVFGKGGTFHVYDVQRDEWREQKGTVPIFSPVRTKDNKIWHTNATPVSTYGVVLFVKYYSASEPKAWVYLYKHAE